MAGQTKRAHANDLKLAEVANWEMSEPKAKKKRTRRATLVEPEGLETDEDSEEEEDREIGQQLITMDHRGLDGTCQNRVHRWRPTASTHRLCRCRKDLITPRRPNKRMTKKTREEVQELNLKLHGQEVESSEWEEEDEVPLSLDSEKNGEM